jgi:hypothetical protein
MSKTSIFDVINQLSENPKMDPVKIAEVLDTRLLRDPAGDSPVTTSYAQPKGVSSRYKEVELRIPDPLFGSSGSLLKATLKSDEGIDSKVIFQQYGLEFQQDVPSPRYPPGLPKYYNYEMPWGTLSLGVTNDEASKLVSFVMKPKKAGK